MTQITNLKALLFLAVVLISGCGGGSNSQPPPEEGSSNWDEMRWDQDNWA